MTQLADETAAVRATCADILKGTRRTEGAALLATVDELEAVLRETQAAAVTAAEILSTAAHEV
ncbi:hypothetical protein [Crossiella equi]|uniref:hypothetical protein n=1 Tax=Crossiella equi TaxID=130796 RepID=UPI001178B00A|nr:hypothetical protein [Crossiella equi]